MGYRMIRRMQWARAVGENRCLFYALGSVVPRAVVLGAPVGSTLWGLVDRFTAEISQEQSPFAERAERNHREGGSRLDREYSTMTLL